MKFESGTEQSVARWAKENLLEGERHWGIVAESKSKEENLFLSLSFKKVQRTRLKLQNGRLERIEEEVTEPETGEFHLRKDGILELYSFSAKQKTSLAESLSGTFGKECIAQLLLQNDAMKSLMTEAIEVNSVSLTGLGNPFFNDATLSGTDPVNSKTYKELAGSGEIKSFRAKFQPTYEDAASRPIIVSVNSKCKLRFFAGQGALPQGDIEDFAKRVSDIASEA